MNVLDCIRNENKVIYLGIATVATSDVEASLLIMTERALFHLSTMTKISSAPKESTMKTPITFATGKLRVYNIKKVKER